MSRTKSSSLQRVAAIGEIVLVTVAFNLIASTILKQLLAPTTLDLAQDFTQPDLYPGGAVSAIRLTLRFGIGILLGFGLLWWRRRTRPAETGVTRAGRSWGSLIVTGVVLWAVATIPFDLLYIVNDVMPFGEGFELFADPGPLLRRADFWAIWLAGAVVLPPLLEETFFRGYARARLAESYGPFAAVIVSSLLFMLMHGHFYSTDPVKVLTLVANIVAVVCWAYVALRTGSIVPGIVAHALGNMPWPRTATVLGGLLVLQLIMIALARTPIREYSRSFVGDWHRADRGAVWFGILLAIACLVPAMTLAAARARGPLLVLAGLWLVVFLTAWSAVTLTEHGWFKGSPAR